MPFGRAWRIAGCCRVRVGKTRAPNQNGRHYSPKRRRRQLNCGVLRLQSSLKPFSDCFGLVRGEPYGDALGFQAAFKRNHGTQVARRPEAVFRLLLMPEQIVRPFKPFSGCPTKGSLKTETRPQLQRLRADGRGAYFTRISPVSTKRWCHDSASFSRCGVCRPPPDFSARSK